MRIEAGVNPDRIVQKPACMTTMPNLDDWPVRRAATDSAGGFKPEGQPQAPAQNSISYRNAGPRQKSMVTMHEMTGGYAASRAVPEGRRVRVAYFRSHARRRAPGFLLLG